MKRVPVPDANPYAGAELADFYDRFDYAGTYWLAVRDLPEIIARQVTGARALDFACGSGRSTRFLKSLGFEAVGVDVSAAMLANARRRDPDGDYLRVGDGDLSRLSGRAFDLILSAFPFASTPTSGRIRAILSELKALLAPHGRLIVVEPTEQLYRHEWVLFTVAAFPENAAAESGERVPMHFRDRMSEPVADFLWTDRDYRQNFQAVGLQILETHRPLARLDDPGPWLSEREIPPWVIYVLAKSETDSR